MTQKTINKTDTITKETDDFFYCLTESGLGYCYSKKAYFKLEPCSMEQILPETKFDLTEKL